MVACGFGGVKWLEALVINNSRRFLQRHEKITFGVSGLFDGLNQQNATAYIIAVKKLTVFGIWS